MTSNPCSLRLALTRRAMRCVQRITAIAATRIVMLVIGGSILPIPAWAAPCPVPTMINGVLTPIIAGSGDLSISDKDNTVSTNGTTFTKIGKGDGGSLNAGSASLQNDTLTLPQFSPSTFPATGSTSVTKTSGQSISPGAYNTLTLSTAGSYSFTAGTYYINSLVISGKTTALTLGAGDYYIRNFDSGQGNNDVTLNTNGVVRLFIGSGLAVHDAFDFNSTGPTANLQIYLFSGASAYFNNNGIFNGLIYAPGTASCIDSDTANNCVYFHDNNIIRGAILSNSTVTLHKSNDINFSSAIRTAIGSIAVPGCVIGPDHYELSLPASGRSCFPSAVKVTACKTAASPCTSISSGANGTTLNLSSNAGALGAKTLTIDATGIATTTLSYPLAKENETVTVTLSGTTLPIQCCKSGTTCTQTSTCSETFTTAGCILDHYELSLPSTGVACDTSPVKVAACASAASPCRTPLLTAGGTSVQLATTNGTLATTSPAFDTDGVATTTLRYTTAKDNDTATVSLLSNTPTWCCQEGNCITSKSCTETFKTAGFIFSETAGGMTTTFPPVVAGCSTNKTDSRYYLRAIKSGSTAGICQAAFTGSQSISFGYQCNNPNVCNGGEMSLSGQTILANPDGKTSSTRPIALTFDTSGNALIAFDYYSDAGQIRLFATASNVNGFSNAFVVAPAKFAISGIPEAPLTAGDPFNVTVTAQNACTSATPNFGKETSAATATLTSSNPTPAQGNASNISATLAGFSNGVASTNLTWQEVGTIDLTATTSAYLDSKLDVTGTRTGVGRFRPAYFDVTQTLDCNNFNYAGQPFKLVTVTAKNSGGATTKNYGGTYVDPISKVSTTGYAKDVTLSAVSYPETTPATVLSGGLTDTTNKIIASAFKDGVASTRPIYAFSDKLTAPEHIALRAVDTDTRNESNTADIAAVSSKGHAEPDTIIRSGRLQLFNAFGSNKAALNMPIQAQYWSGKSWVINSDDSCTTLPNSAFALSSTLATQSGITAAVTLAKGNAAATLRAPDGAAAGSVDVALNLGTSGSDQSCLTAHGGTGANAPWLRSLNGNCASNYDRDPWARATFGIYSPETRRLIYVQDVY